MSASSPPVRSVQEFLERYWKAPQKAGTRIRILRGQAQADPWKLLPKLFRDETMPIEKIEALEDKLIEAFYNEALYLLPSVPDTRFDKVSLAQHHGLPTRLLDWTANPLLGLFFAVESQNPPAPTVWMYDATDKQIEDGEFSKYNDLDHEKTMFIEPARHSARVASQAGWHTIHRFHGEGENRKVRPLDAMDYHKDRITVVRIDPSCARDIRSQLNEMGVKPSTVYGDLGSVCRGIAVDLQLPEALR